VLLAEKTKTYETREIPVTQRLAAILEMRRVAPDGRSVGLDAYVFGNEVGEPIASIKTAWYAACRRASITGLCFHDLRREFASRVRETPGNSDHEVRDLLGHANISTTSRYLGSTPETRERAMHRFEQHHSATHYSHRAAECDNPTGPAEELLIGRKSRRINGLVNGGEGRNRTVDTTIFSRMLYQLSYLATRWKDGDHTA
jgi:Phage integrase family